jgi:hypothetical protein
VRLGRREVEARSAALRPPTNGRRTDELRHDAAWFGLRAARHALGTTYTSPDTAATLATEGAHLAYELMRRTGGR